MPEESGSAAGSGTAGCVLRAVLGAVLRAMLWGRWLLPGASLALGAGLGAALTARWQRGAGGTEVAEGLLSRLPVVPVVAAATGPPAPVEPARTELTKYGLPGLAQLRSRESYVLCYDPRSRSALWVIEQLNRETLSGTSERSACDFQEDDSVHEYHRATNADYRGSGFDRGHLAAAANHKWSQKAMRDTFYLSNVAPQVRLALGRRTSLPAVVLWHLWVLWVLCKPVHGFQSGGRLFSQRPERPGGVMGVLEWEV